METSSSSFILQVDSSTSSSVVPGGATMDANRNNRLLTRMVPEAREAVVSVGFGKGNVSAVLPGAATTTDYLNVLNAVGFGDDSNSNNRRLQQLQQQQQQQARNEDASQLHQPPLSVGQGGNSFVFPLVSPKQPQSASFAADEYLNSEERENSSHAPLPDQSNKILNYYSTNNGGNKPRTSKQNNNNVNNTEPILVSERSGEASPPRVVENENSQPGSASKRKKPAGEDDEANNNNNNNNQTSSGNNSASKRSTKQSHPQQHIQQQQQQQQQGQIISSINSSSSAAAATATSSNANRKLESFFRPKPSSSASSSSSGVKGEDSEMLAVVDSLQNEVRTLQEQLKQSQEAVARLQVGEKHWKDECQKKFEKLSDLELKQQQQNAVGQANLVALLRELGRAQRDNQRTRFQQETNRLGRITQQRRDYGFTDVWEDGDAFKELNRRTMELESKRERLEEMKKRRKPRGRAAAAAGGGGGEGGGAAKLSKSGSGGGGGGGNATTMMPPPSHVPDEELEIVHMKLVRIKEELDEIAEERDRLEKEKAVFFKEYKRQRDETASQFGDFPLLNNRYLLLRLLGRGGFSEVFKAFDLQEMCVVACKMHHISSSWSVEKIEGYWKHSERESEIQKRINHRHVVRSIEVFRVSDHCMCAVLEYCNDGDLDVRLKSRRTLPEREARCIVIQILTALRFFSTGDPENRIIHYDLKPANILFHNGEVKIADFGLSKEMPDSDASRMEHTSQGAGTYWYLPPECFIIPPPPISPKVDIWSLGVIFYQMLVGKRPFGEGKTQDDVYRLRLVSEESKVEFPKEAKVSVEAQEFIKKCLTPRQDDRPTADVLLQENYLRLPFNSIKKSTHAAQEQQQQQQ